MKHQLIPNTYTVCESPKQCKELFEWAKNNSIITYLGFYGYEIIITCDDDYDMMAFSDDRDKDVEFWAQYQEIPLPEFIARLKGEYTNP